jgi:hypothetical protein
MATKNPKQKLNPHLKENTSPLPEKSGLYKN